MLTLLVPFLGVTILAGTSIGPVGLSLADVWGAVLSRAPGGLGGEVAAATVQIVWVIRLPRVLLAAVVGAGLAVVGATLQAVVRNPLADPYLFGVTSGASVGAVAVILLGASLFGVYSLSAAAFLGGLAALAVVFALAQRGGVLSPLRLVLAGVACSYALSAVTSVMVFRADGTGHGGAVRSVLFWLLGGLGGARWSYLALPAGVVVAGTAVLMTQRRKLNALMVGDETAVSLGVDVDRLRRRLFVLASLVTGVMVAVSGGIGFVGLMIPHIVRLLVGSDHRHILPVSALGGAAFLVWVDVAARIVVAPSELPIGVITALLGAPFFLWLLRRRADATSASGVW